jgi:hypothetical protein
VLAAIAVAGAALAAGPVEFGRAELERAVAARKASPGLSRIKTEVAVDPAESYRITSGVITGGDLRGVMYGLLEAAEQVRKTGRIQKAEGRPGMAIRGVRVFLKDFDAADWFYARERWPVLFRTLALNRFNRFNLVLPELAALVADQSRSLDALRFISDTAAEYGVDFTLGLWMPQAADGPAVYDALGKVLRECPAIRSVQVRMDAAPGMYAVQAVQSAGRRVIIEAAADATAIAGAATSGGVPLRTSAPYPNTGLGGRRGEFMWELGELGARNARGLVSKLAATGASGFEIDLLDATAQPDAAWLALGRLAYDSQEAK